MSKPQKLLVEQRDALWDYLDALLQEIPEDIDEPEVAAAPVEIQEWEPEALAAPVEVRAEPVDPGEIEPEQPAVVVPAVPAVERVAAPELAAVPVASPEVQPEPVEDGVPGWADPEFQALLFKVDGLTLAVPKVKLHSVIPWTDKVAPLPNQPDWCRGLLRYREANVQVVDTGRLVIPADRRGKLEAQPAAHILIVGDGRWGLVCSELGDVVRLEPDEVKWRSARGQRPWLAGTVLNHLCVLMDTEAFAGMLAREQKASRR